MDGKKKKRGKKSNFTVEATAFLGGLFQEFQQQTVKYELFTAQLLSLEAQIELVEKTLCLTRDHLALEIRKTQSAVPNNWGKVLRNVRFVGVRLADACKVLLQENKKLTPDQLLSGLNDGMFRFRTNSPLREIHAALLKQSFAKKTDTQYSWIGTTEEQLPLRLRVLKAQVISREPMRNGTTGSAQGARE